MSRDGGTAEVSEAAVTGAPADALAAADELNARIRAVRTEVKDDAQLETLALAVTANLPVLL